MNVPVCGSGDSLSVDLYLNHTLVNPIINVNINGIDFGNRRFSNDSVFIRNIAPISSLPELLNFEFTSENGECSWSTVVRKPTCNIGNDTICELSDPRVELSLCDSLGDFYAHINFDTLGVNDSFEIRINTDLSLIHI